MRRGSRRSGSSPAAAWASRLIRCTRWRWGAVLAVCRAAYDRWSARADNDLTVYLDAALTALAAGFAADKIKAGMPKAD
jgi:MftR C-terminal domain